MKILNRIFFMVIGAVFLLLGIIGIFLPLLPTTPFVLLTAFCWARSSTRFHTWLLTHKWFGSIVSNWESHRVIPLKAKWLSTIMMNGAIIASVLTMPEERWWVKVIMIIIGISVSLWIWSFPHSIDSVEHKVKE